MSDDGSAGARLRIAWVCGSRIVGGAERATLAVLGGLRERGHDIAVIHPRQSAVAQAATAAGLPASGALRTGLRSGYGYADIRRVFAGADAALISGIEQWLPALLARRPDTARVVLVRHMALPVSAALRWLAARRADAIVAVSTAVRDQLRGRAGDADRLHVIYNPVRLPIRAAVPSRAARAEARQRLDVPGDGHCVAFLGGYVRSKGLADAMRAVRAANHRFGPTHLLVCGAARRAGEPAAAKQEAAELGVAARCHHLGEVEAVADVLTAADAVIAPTHRGLSEGLPLVVLEAMACGTPVVAYAVGGIPEALGAPCPTGYLAPPDQPEALAAALLAALGDRDGANRHAAAALERARALFEPAHIAAQYERLLHAVCRERR